MTGECTAKFGEPFFKSGYFKACNVFHIGKGKVVKNNHLIYPA